MMMMIILWNVSCEGGKFPYIELGGGGSVLIKIQEGEGLMKLAYIYYIGGIF